MKETEATYWASEFTDAELDGLADRGEASISARMRSTYPNARKAKAEAGLYLGEIQRRICVLLWIGVSIVHLRNLT